MTQYPNTIEGKLAEIENYKRILRENQHSRWYDMGRRHLAELEKQLAQLQQDAIDQAW